MNPLKPIFYHTIDELHDDDFDVDCGNGVITARNPWTGTLVKRKIHQSTIKHRGRLVEYILMGGIKYFIV